MPTFILTFYRELVKGLIMTGVHLLMFIKSPLKTCVFIPPPPKYVYKADMGITFKYTSNQAEDVN